MKGRKTSLLKWAAMIELVIGAYNLMTGVMSAYVLITDLDGVMASFADSGVEYSAAILGVSVAITALGGLIMAVAGGIGMVFSSLQGKQKLPIYCGYGLFAFVILSDIIQIATMGAGFSLSMLFPFVLHGFYMWGAVKNKKELDGAVM
ncbi:MAG TPA: hypothetical protein H9913_08110 [Candidatus Blautia stercoripullorum]|uniref:Uncharacterized protein n=1 Tax=Candidatus Blautia stercoripullorum TaxID=2838502 RepID=A0A9D2RCP9_9FIRM|nr:hypothetical protein [Candidatus Blautia stercoripullorum]